ncbi:MAG TPA: DUF6625 family protein [Vicinamibacterales bacterium]|nr:DUF6625 family protein [Vicinamibacterales bacterium]
MVAFFGRAPLWLPAFLVSCRANRDVRWMIYTDVEPATRMPPNVDWKYMNVGELSSRASDVLGTNVEIRSSYTKKISDLKLSFGLVFADDLRPFDFWAHSDLDIVWGDVRQFVTDDILASYDIVSSRPGRTSGHFNLYRNTPAINRTFELIPDYAQAMANPEYLHLDERELTRHLKARLSRGPSELTPRVYWPQELTTNAKYQHALGDSDAGGLWWRNGKTFGAEGHELMYVHFHKLKHGMHSIDFGYDDAPSAFMISRKGFSAAGQRDD